MAFGIRPPNIAECIVNLGEAAEYMFDHNIFQDNLVGVDFCEQMVKETNPGVYERAERTESPHADRHGYRTIADIMQVANPFTGSFYREALQMSRMTREMFCLMEGRHVHPSTLYPGGVGTVPTVQLFTDYLVRLMKYVEFMKKVVPMHDDLFDFFYEALPGYEEVGRRRILLGCWGSFQNPDVCDYTYKNMTEWGRAMYVTPGRGGRRSTGHHRSGEDQPGHSHSAREALTTTTGKTPRRSSSKTHWATRSIASIPGTRPRCRSRRSATSRASTPGSCRRGGMTSAPRTTLRSTPAAGRSPGSGRPRWRASSISATSRRPATASRSTCPRRRRCPKSSSSGRFPSGATRSSATGPALISRPMRPPPPFTSVEQASKELHAGRNKTWTEFKVPDEAIGCGFHEAVRGVLSHHVVIRNGKIANYHPYPPTPWNANPRDIYGTPGPYEDAVQNTPIFEENGPDKFKGIDIMRGRAQLRSLLAVRRSHVPGQWQGLESRAFADVWHGRSLGAAIVNANKEPEVRRRIEHLETLIHDLERLPDPAARDQARELVQTLLDFHGAAVSKILKRIAELGEPGHASIARSAVTTSCRTCSCYTTCIRSTWRPASARHSIRCGLTSELTRATSSWWKSIDGIVRLRMQGSCHGCPSSALTLKNAIEEAIYAAAPGRGGHRGRGGRRCSGHAGQLLPIVTLDPRLTTRSTALPA